jgi:hypothetical protein
MLAVIGKIISLSRTYWDGSCDVSFSQRYFARSGVMIQTSRSEDRPFECVTVDKIFVGFIFPMNVNRNCLSNSF